jgi:hypothetical protein
MGMRRITRLTHGFSKKAENLAHAVSLHFMYYNFVRIHQSLRVTPAIRAGITDRLWTVEDIAKLVEFHFTTSTENGLRARAGSDPDSRKEPGRFNGSKRSCGGSGACRTTFSGRPRRSEGQRHSQRLREGEFRILGQNAG